MKKLVFTNGRVITLERVIPLGGVVVCNGKIEDVYSGEYSSFGNDAQIIDAAGRYISPGFIDIHVHGGGGHDFMCGEADKVIDACKIHMRHGTTAIVPTVSSADHQLFVSALAAINEASERMDNGPEVLGLHLEGPYFAMSQKGAQDARYVRDPNPAEYMQIINNFDNILRWSIAPELTGALKMAGVMRARGIRMSIGHSDALYDEAVRAFECGFDTITHLYSCCSTVRRINAYRHAGVLEAAFQLDGMMVEVIADGKHLPQSLLKLIYKIKGPESICLITDSISVGGLTGVKGEIYSQTCGATIVIEDEVAKLPDRSAFAGSVATTDRLVRTMAELDEVPIYQAVKMASATPAKNIGVFNRKGSLSPGKDADIVLFDDGVNVSTVMVNGNITYKA